MNARVTRLEMGRTSDDDIVVRVCVRSDLRVNRDRRPYFLGSSLRVGDHNREEDREVVSRAEETCSRKKGIRRRRQPLRRPSMPSAIVATYDVA